MLPCPICRPLSTTPDIATSDRDPSACRPPALDLQSTDTAAAAPAHSLRSSWRHVTHVRSPKIRHIECNEPARNLLPGAWSGFLSDRSLAKDRAGTAGSRLPTERGQDKSRTLPARSDEGETRQYQHLGAMCIFDPRCAISEKPSKINIDPHIARRGHFQRLAFAQRCEGHGTMTAWRAVAGPPQPRQGSRCARPALRRGS